MSIDSTSGSIPSKGILKNANEQTPKKSVGFRNLLGGNQSSHIGNKEINGATKNIRKANSTYKKAVSRLPTYATDKLTIASRKKTGALITQKNKGTETALKTINHEWNKVYSNPGATLRTSNSKFNVTFNDKVRLDHTPMAEAIDNVGNTDGVPIAQATIVTSDDTPIAQATPIASDDAP